MYRLTRWPSWLCGFWLCMAGCTHRGASPADLALAAEGAVADARPASEQGCLKPPDLGRDAPTADRGLADAVADAPGDASTAALDHGASDLAHDALLDALPSSDATHDGPPAPDAAPPCPAAMVPISPTTCIDRYEASRPDATATSQGGLVGPAQSRPGVLPWHSFALSLTEAQAACAAAGKRLCTASEWQLGCGGPQQTVYAYGNAYQPATCNGIDTFCLCGPGQPCQGVTPCPYPHCFSLPPPGSTAPACGAAFHVMPTGSFPGCTRGDGVYDLNGNVWELVASTDGQLHFRGGAYNCGNSEQLHRCDYDATWGPTAQGFRCCADAVTTRP